MMRVGVIGAGISGLTTALALAQNGHEVEVFEREAEVGGLISTFDLAGTRIERYYHFLCGGDTGYFELCRMLGLANRIVFRKASTGFFYEGREYGFTTPLDLLRFTPIPLSQRIRFGLFALEARWRREWQQLDEIMARPWLIDRIGQQAYDVIWHPLLALKFGDLHEKISAAWVWHRLYRVAQSKGKLGYLEGGTGLLLDTLVDRIRAAGGIIHTQQAVSRILTEGNHVRGLKFANGDIFECDHVVSTLPLSILAHLLPPEQDAYRLTLQGIRYIGVVCIVLKLTQPVSRNFWLNINDTRIPSNGIIEYTNLNRLDDRHGHIVYVPYYVATDHPLYRASDEEVFRQSWDSLQCVNPALCADDVIAYQVFRSSHAQAICPTGFLSAIPDAHAPIEGLRLLDSVYLYPEDRTQSGLATCAFDCAREFPNAGS